MNTHSIPSIFFTTALIIAFCVILLPKLLELLTRRMRARRAARQRSSVFFILTDDIGQSPDLQKVAAWLKEEFGIKPTISAKLPRNAGEDIVTIEEVHGRDNTMVCVIEHMNHAHPLQHGVCQCPLAFEPCQCAVLQVLVAT